MRKFEEVQDYLLIFAIPTAILIYIYNPERTSEQLRIVFQLILQFGVILGQGVLLFLGVIGLIFLVGGICDRWEYRQWERNHSN